MITTDESKMALFDLKQKFLRQIPHPKLIQSAIKKAARHHGSHYEEQTLLSVKLNASHQQQLLADFLEETIARELRLKHQISQANSFGRLIEALEDLYLHQVQICLKLQSYVNVELSDQHKQAIKMSDPFDLYEILKSIEKEMTNEAIQEVLQNELSQNTFEPGVLATACIRAQKIIKHG
jgi:hypothetical protein